MGGSHLALIHLFITDRFADPGGTLSTRRIQDDDISAALKQIEDAALCRLGNVGRNTSGICGREFVYDEPAILITLVEPLLEGWLFARRYQYGRFIVHEFPTTDARGIPSDVAEAAKGCVLDLLESSRNVVVLDS